MGKILLFWFILLNYTFFSTSVSAESGTWLLIDTEKLKLEVKKGDKTLATMGNIAIGRNGAGYKQYVGDDITPLGSYKIGWVNNKSAYHRFYGLTYPSVEYADEALLGGLLSKNTHRQIINAHKNNKIPLQSTAIGGRIGIHGLGAADEKVHNIMNWTHGCIALTNKQIDQLQRWIRIGMPVKIK